MYHGKTLVVFFCMHRSGSSFASRLFQRLGMSLGPFELLGAQESNPHGHFEAAPFVEVNRQVQFQSLGFSEDRPHDLDTLQRLLAGGGQWPLNAAIADHQLQVGKELIEQLVASGRISGFKDPRTVLTWPFWESVLRSFTGLRVVPLFLLRSPHEIAMSLFRRGQGDFPYAEALDIAAIHYGRMRAILDSWRGDRAVLQFEPGCYARQASVAAATCGLQWDDAALAETFDAECRHQNPASVAHAAQAMFEQLGGASGQRTPQDNLRQLLADATQREQFLQTRHKILSGEVPDGQIQELPLVFQLRRLEVERLKWEADRRQLGIQLHTLTSEKTQWEADRRQLEANLMALQAEKAQWDEYRRSRGWAILQAIWRLRELLIPRHSRREAAAQWPFRFARAVAYGARQIVSL